MNCDLLLPTFQFRSMKSDLHARRRPRRSRSGRRSLFIVALCLSTVRLKFNHTNKVGIHQQNIARGTTDPGYWVFSLNYLVDLLEFVSFLDNLSFRLNCLGPLCHHLNCLQIWPPVENWATKWHHFISVIHSFKIWSLAPKYNWFQCWATLGDVRNMTTRLRQLHCHITLHCSIGITS